MRQTLKFQVEAFDLEKRGHHRSFALIPLKQCRNTHAQKKTSRRKKKEKKAKERP